MRSLGSIRIRKLRAAFLAFAAVGCNFTQTATSVRSVPGAAEHRLRPASANSAPLRGSWTQETNALIGALAFTDECVIETEQTTARYEVTETRGNSKTATGWIVAGSLLSLVGVGIYASTAGADETVHCGSGGSPEAGDECHSEKSVQQELGVAVLGLGLGSLVAGGITLARKPTEESKALPVERSIRRSTDAQRCGELETLEGTQIAVEIPGRGSWSGAVNPEGAVRIELAPELTLPRAEVRFKVQKVPAAIEGLVAIGLDVGGLSLEATKPQPARKPPSTAARSRSSASSGSFAHHSPP
ncbi:MAG: hypothetical protein M3020_02820 [Myxococcota bacterium]|nr:hypothetical protein [Myxococcota bacterium]